MMEANSQSSSTAVDCLIPDWNAGQNNHHHHHIYSSTPPFSSQNGIAEFLMDNSVYLDPSNQSSVVPQMKKLSISSTGTSISDSGTESIVDDDDGGSDNQDDAIKMICANEKLLNYFAQDDSKTTRLARRRLSDRVPTPHNADKRKLKSKPDVEDDDEDEDVDNDTDDDESTLSESSCPSTPAEYSCDDSTPRPSLFDFDQVCAAIGDKLMERLVADIQNNNGGNHLNANDMIVPVVADMVAERPSSTSILDEYHCDDDGRDANVQGDDGHDVRKAGGLLRSTSLRTGKTPPGTPGGGKKIVRFADALGLDLASVRHIVDDGPYQPPLAAFKGLKLDDDDDDHQERRRFVPVAAAGSSKPVTFALRMLFAQPASDPVRFLDSVRANKICLENCMVTGRRSSTGTDDVYRISCIIRVQNVCFHKRITLRYTTNEWLTWQEIPATYVPNSNDLFSDKFEATLEVTATESGANNGRPVMVPGQRLLFALRFEAIDDGGGGQEFWDNNNGMNYSFIYQRC